MDISEYFKIVEQKLDNLSDEEFLKLLEERDTINEQDVIHNQKMLNILKEIKR